LLLQKVIHMDSQCPTLPATLARYEERKIRKEESLPGEAGAGIGGNRSAMARGQAI
jgi:hypothetical protein